MGAARFRRLPTEQPNPRSRRIDERSIPAIVRIINGEDARVPRAVAAAAPRIARAARVIADSLGAGGRLLFIGAGTSGRLAVLEAAECPPTFGTPPHLVRAVMAGGRRSVFRAREGAEDDPVDGARRVRTWLREGRAPHRRRVVVGIAASGVTPFVRGALAAARKAGCRTVLVTSNVRTPIRDAEIVIAPRVGPEVISGSTRMKSATAAKLVLNTLTTAAMIRLGKVHDNWMVDLRPTSEKLRQRALRIVADLGRVRPREAERLFAESGAHVKTAVLMARRGLGRSAARRRLKACDGRLRAALATHSRRRGGTALLRSGRRSALREEGG